MRPYLLSFTFTDNSGGKADDIALTLQDRGGVWLRDWVPAKSDTISASIFTGTKTLPCGTFSIDQIDYTFPPRTIAIKGVSSDLKRGAVTQQKTRAWEEMNLSEICASIAAENSLGLFLDIQEDYPVIRTDQISQADLDFLRELCADFGWSVKLQKDRLVVYSTEQYENAVPSTEIDIGDRRVLSCRFSSKGAKVYRKARVRYHDPVKDEDYDEEYEDDAEEGSERVLEVWERAESKEDAQRIARERVTEANRREITGAISIMGEPDIAAGITVMLSGFGMFSGKHFVNKVTHKVDGGGYVTDLELGQPKEAKKESHGRKTARKATGGTAGELFYEGEHYYR